MSTPTPSKSVLGKGLASLLPPVQPAQPEPSSTGSIPPQGMGLVAAGSAKPNFDPTEVPGTNRDRHPGIALASIDDIKANEFQPRRNFDQTALEELAQSIKENGLIQPLVVRKNGDKYELIAGERRLRASKIAGLKSVPIVIRKSTDREALELAIVENIQREDLNPVDEGLAYFQLMQEFQLSQEELAKRMGKERATIANALRILKLSDFILSELKKGSLSRGHAKALLAVDDTAVREKFAKEILEKNFSVRQSEKLAQELKTPKSASPIATTKNSTALGVDAELMKLTRELTQRYMSKVEIKGTKKSGAISIQYSSEAELVRIFSLLLGDRA
ncbi:MAG: ParB/RepB/Spo0J family partition protein [Bdellovibrionales bacterium]|nr:ParB/RepB/Spo0J family partition protein [Bdellovibrionales bacterium]